MENKEQVYYEHDLTGELYREIVFPSGAVYRINKPVKLIIREGGSTHKVIDANGMVHMYPFGGTTDTVVRWQPRNAEQPVSF